MECSSVLPTTKFAYWKGLGICHALLCMSHTSVLESGEEAGIVQIDFSGTFDKVNHQGILHKLCSVGIGGSVLYIDTVSIKQITACYGGWLLEETSELFSIVENILIGYADDSTLMAVVPSPGVRVTLCRVPDP